MDTLNFSIKYVQFLTADGQFNFPDKQQVFSKNQQDRLLPESLFPKNTIFDAILLNTFLCLRMYFVELTCNFRTGFASGLNYFYYD